MLKFFIQKYAKVELLTIFLLGIISAIPLVITGSTLSNRLTSLDIDRGSIGLFALCAMPYSLKFLWSSIFDLHSAPIFGKFLSRDKSWILLSSIILFFVILLLGLVDPVKDLWAVAYISLLVGFCGASLDIAIDSYRIKLFSGEREHMMAFSSGFYVYGYRVGIIIAGAGAIYLLSFLSWWEVCSICAAFMFISIIAVIIGPEVIYIKHKSSKNWQEIFHSHVVEPLISLASRKNFMFIILFIISFKLPDAFLGNMANSFYVDAGFSNVEIAQIIKVYGLFMTLIGIFLGGWLFSKVGYGTSLLVSIICQSISNLFYLLVVHYGNNTDILTIVITVENIFGSISQVVIIGYLSSLCKLEFSATHYAILSSIITFGRNLLSAGGGFVVKYYGYSSFFIFSALLGIIPLLFFFTVINSLPKKHVQSHNK